MKFIYGSRVSHVQNEGKISHIQQNETCYKKGVSLSYEPVGTFEDLGVSADKFSPFQRPGLGYWLDEEHLHEWDVIVFSKIDRAFRSTNDCVEFAKFLEKHHKIVVFADDGMTLNYRDPQGGFEKAMAEFFVYIGSFFARIELERFKSRALDRSEALRGTDRFSHGKPPLGFRIVDHPSGKGKSLEHDPAGQQKLHTIANQLLSGWSIHQLADEHDMSVSGLKHMLTSTAVQGEKQHKQKPLLDNQGKPIMVGKPSFDPETWDKIQTAIKDRERTGKRRRHSDNPVLGVAFCAHCQGAMSQHITSRGEKTYYNYRCARGCHHMVVKADELEKTLEWSFLHDYGDKPIVRKVFVPGEDRSYELVQVKESMARLRRESDLGLIDDEELYFARLSALKATMTELEATPVRGPQWVDESTGELNSDAWASRDALGRRELLREQNIKLWVKDRDHMHLE